jgi:putative peptidoglycan lipid II flippase
MTKKQDPPNPAPRPPFLEDAEESFALPAAGEGAGERVSAYAAGMLDTSMLPEEMRNEAPPPSGPPTGRTTSRRLAGAAALVGIAFALSRVLGMVRSAAIASQFPPIEGDIRADAYAAAFNIPDTLFLLIIGGAVGSAFIPVFSELMEQKREDEAWRLTSTLINASIMLLALGGILLGLLAPALVGSLLAPDFAPDKKALTVDLTRIMLLSPLLLGLGGWAQGILNARQQFTLPAFAPIMYNLAIIAGALLLAPIFGIYGVAYGVVAGAGLHFLVQVPGLWRAGMHYQPFHLRLQDAGVGRVLRLMGPRIIGQAAFQLNFLALTNVASSLPTSGLAAFNYAYTLMLLPHGIFAMSLATVLFPTMTAQVGRGDLAAMRGTLSGGLRVLVFLSLPAAVLMGLLRHEIVSFVFQFYRFDAAAVERVAAPLGWFAWGLPAYVLVELLTRGYFALHDTRTPVIVSVVTVAANIALSRVLVQGLHMDQSGMALSLALTTTAELVGLWWPLRRRLPGLFDAAFLRGAGVSLLGAGLMGAVLWPLVPFLEANIVPAPDPISTKVATVLVGGLAGLVGLALYLGLARLLRADELTDALRLLRRRGGR